MTSAKYIFAADLGGTKCSAAVVDRQGRITALRTEPVDRSSPLAPVQQICRMAAERASGRPIKQAFAAAAIAVPGLVRRDGTVWAPNLPKWERMALGSRLQRALGIRVVVESDRNAAVLGECWQGAGRDKGDVIVLIVGTGVGAGILSGGRIIRGAHELSGCAGWLSIFREENELAPRLGQLESLCSGPAVATITKNYLKSGRKSGIAKAGIADLTARQIAAAARKGDSLAVHVFAEMGIALGYGVANLVSLFDPEVMVLAGGMANAADLYLEPMKKAMFSRAQPLAAKKVKIAVSKLGQTGNLLGCASLAWEATRTRKK